MVWTAEQKANGRRELARRRACETVATYRRSFFVAAGWGAFGLFLSGIGWSMVRDAVDWSARLGGILTLLVAVPGLAVFAVLGYVRYLDWRRASA
jgi:hypothetical protein